MADEQATPQAEEPKQEAPKAESGADVAATLKALQDRIARDTVGVRRGNMITGLVGIILAIVLFATLGSLVTGLSEAMQPKNLAEAMSGYILPQIPTIAANLKEDLETRAPEYVGMLFDAAEDNLPNLRVKAEEGAVDILNKLLEDLEKNTNEAIALVIKHANKADLQKAIDAAYEGKPEVLEKYFKEELEEMIGMNLDRILKEKYYPQMEDIERQLDQLLTIDEGKLTFEQRQKRELVMTVMVLVDQAAEESAE